MIFPVGRLLDATEVFGAVTAYFRERLDDPGLLERAVIVGLDLAVPIGGKRRGGYCQVPPWEEHDAAPSIRRLRDAGFPDIAVRPGGEADDDVDNVPIIEWGERPEPYVDHEDPVQAARLEIRSGRLYGYSEAAIWRHIRRHFGASHSRVALLAESLG